MDDRSIRNIALGNINSFRELYEAYYDRLFYYGYKILKDRDAVKDIVQDTFVLFWEKRKGFTSVIAVKDFLYRSLHNKLLTHIRNSGIRTRILSSMEKRETVTDDHIMIRAEIYGEVNRALEVLPEQTKNVILMSMKGMTVEEIADKLKRSVNTVKTLKKNGYKTLRLLLNHLKSLIFFYAFDFFRLIV